MVCKAGQDIERGLAEQLRAIADNPGNAHYRSLYAFPPAHAGQSKRAIEELEKAMQLNPRHPDLYYAHYGRALFNLRRYDEAILPLEKIRTSQPGNGNTVSRAAKVSISTVSRSFNHPDPVNPATRTTAARYMVGILPRTSFYG